MTAKDFANELAEYGDDTRAVHAVRFFKTGKGQYGEGDQFMGASVPNTRLVCKKFKDLPLAEIQNLLDSPIHEHRLAAVILLANQYKAAKKDQQKRREIFDLYLKNVRKGKVNNWDIVDSSAAYIVGPELENTDRKLLYDLAKSADVWQKRVGIMSAFWYVRHGDPSTTLDLAETLLHDQHDLIQKAVGWQLREIGKNSGHDLLMQFLDKHAATMPRTALRYAIEHLTPTQKSHYMSQAKIGRR